MFDAGVDAIVSTACWVLCSIRWCLPLLLIRDITEKACFTRFIRDITIHYRRGKGMFYKVFIDNFGSEPVEFIALDHVYWAVHAHDAAHLSE